MHFQILISMYGAIHRYLIANGTLGDFYNTPPHPQEAPRTYLAHMAATHTMSHERTPTSRSAASPAPSWLPHTKSKEK